MKELTGLLAMLALVASGSIVSAQDAAAPKDDCEEQSATDDDACSPAVPVADGGAALGGLDAGAAAALGIGALALVALAGGSSGSHSGSH